jgi:hypothetical protein
LTLLVEYVLPEVGPDDGLRLAGASDGGWRAVLSAAGFSDDFAQVESGEEAYFSAETFVVEAAQCDELGVDSFEAVFAASVEHAVVELFVVYGAAVAEVC